MYTAAEVDALRERLAVEGKSKAETVRALAWACLGWPYVFGAWGEMCTPQERRYRAGLRPDHQKKIYDACPVLSGDLTTCAGCGWHGTRCFDCRGFTCWILEQVGLDLYGQGATTQYDTAGNWAAKGDIKDMPEGLVCCVFKRRDGKMTHTGMHVGGGEIVHCSTIVKPGTLSDRPAWTHYAIPAGLYTNEELKEAGVNVDEGKNIPTLRRGAEGDLVKLLQKKLNDFLHWGLEVDGKFGEKTENAVRQFQHEMRLTVDGIVGPKTWAALGMDFNESEQEPEDPESWPEDPSEEPEDPAAHPPDEEMEEALDELSKHLRQASAEVSQCISTMQGIADGLKMLADGLKEILMGMR